MAPGRRPTSAEPLLLLAALLAVLAVLHAHDLTVRCYLYDPAADRDGGGGRPRTNTCYYDRYDGDGGDDDDDDAAAAAGQPPASARQQTVFVLNSVQLVVRTNAAQNKDGKFDRSNYIYDIIRNITIVV